MKAKVTEEGLLVPKELLEGLGSEEVEIIEERGRVLILPSGGSLAVERGTGEEDPIEGLGANPVDDDITDASVNHDRYLYGA